MLRNLQQKSSSLPKVLSTTLAFVTIIAAIMPSASPATLMRGCRVAVLGSGISGSTAARTLAESGVSVTIFEAGYGIGGRTSTRVTRPTDDIDNESFQPYQFDHGGQYIGAPKTETFRETLKEWQRKGWVQEWKGVFAKEDSDGNIVLEESAKERYVGFPRMNSICQNLLDHEKIEVILQTRANAVSIKDETGDSASWRLSKDNSKAREEEDLGSYDWLVVSDRLSAAPFRKDLRSEDLKNDFKKSLTKIQNVKSLTAMVVLESSLGLDVNGVQFSPEGGAFGSLGWIARDSSKPGRDRTDGKECWVLQSHPKAATQLLASIEGRQTADKARAIAREVLVDDFQKLIPSLAAVCGQDDNTITPSIVKAIGHRWGAAFPISCEELSCKESDVHLSNKLVSCGDYYGKYTGRIEGAYLSGLSAAKQLLEQLK